jgi:transposase InsO family protein
MSVESTARAFLVSGQTVMNWLDEVKRGAARLIRSREPMNALPGLVREISFFLRREWPRWGTRRIAGILARLGLKASRTSVQRILRRQYFRPPSRSRRGRGGSPLRARHVGHVWVVDFTVVRTFFRSIVVGAVLDSCSRKALALRVWRTEPNAAGACLLLRDAIQAHGSPGWLVSDRGRQFRSERFRTLLARQGIRRRFAALGDPNLSRIDRYWRAMKDEFARGLFLFKPLRALERQLRGYARWHATERPHQGLGHRAPDDVHAGRTRRRIRHLERGFLEVTFIDGDRRLPVFRLRSVA